MRVVDASGYPEAYLTLEKSGRLRKEISECLTCYPASGALRFNDMFIRARAIVMEATDIWSLDWMVERNPTFGLKERLNMEVKGIEDLQRITRATILIPGTPENSSTALRRLSYQSPSL